MLVVELIALAALLALSALFSGSETALFSLTGAQRARIRARSAVDDTRIASCLANSAALLSTLLVGNTFVNFAAATLGYLVLSDCIPHGGGALWRSAKSRPNAWRCAMASPRRLFARASCCS